MSKPSDYEGHTPGPWSLNPSDTDKVGNLTIRGPAGWPIAETCGHGLERKTNARLIAAAPDLLARVSRLEAALRRDAGMLDTAAKALKASGVVGNFTLGKLATETADAARAALEEGA